MINLKIPKKHLLAFVDLFRDFYFTSKYSAGFTMTGMYNIGFDDLMLAFIEYAVNGVNYLDEHAEITWITWDFIYNEDGKFKGLRDNLNRKYYSSEELETAKNILAGQVFWDLNRFMDDEEKFAILEKIQRTEKYISSKEKRKKKKNANRTQTKKRSRNFSGRN
jgi:hypothetical protein